MNEHPHNTSRHSIGGYYGSWGIGLGGVEMGAVMKLSYVVYEGDVRDVHPSPLTAENPFGRPLSITIQTADVAQTIPGWQDMSTAPKDGTLFLAYSATRAKHLADMPEEYVFLLYWERDRFRVALDGATIREATHWMPLPTPPASQSTPELPDTPSS